jgi:RNA polymerase sigma-70 factor (ECF subfamily)
MQPSDRAWRERGLRQAVLAGDEQAWRTWYDECYAGLYAYVLWRCGGLRDRADEVVQDTWLTAVRRLRAFDPAQGAFPGWLRGIAAHLLRNALRRDARRQRRLSVLDADHAVNGSPADDLQRHEQAERVAGALAALPERYEAVLRAKYLEGLSMADIAAASGETVKAVESLLTRARQAFRAAYDQPE